MQTPCVSIQVYYGSREYPHYTGSQSVYNDTLSFEVSTPNGVAASGNATVNSLHDDFVNPSTGVGVHRIVDDVIPYATATANQDSWLELTATTTNVGDGLLGSSVRFEVTCLGVTQPDDGDVFCLGAPITFRVPEIQGATYAWSVVQGDLTPQAASTAVYEATPQASGDIVVRVDVTLNGTTCTDEVAITVSSLDLEFANGGSDLDNGDQVGQLGPVVAEADEETIGGYVLVNWDDDDGDGVMQADGTWQTEPLPDIDETFVANEDNLGRLVMTMNPVPAQGTVELHVTGNDAHVRIWSSSTKGTRYNSFEGYPWRFDLANPAQRQQFLDFSQNGLWVEGHAPSATERDTSFVLKYIDANGVARCEDTVLVTSVMINLANAVYREGQIAGISGRGHSAIVCQFLGPLTRPNLQDDANFRIIHVQNGGPTDIHTLTAITASPGEDAWGCFTNPGITYTQRLRILVAARLLVTRAQYIAYTGMNAVLGIEDEQHDPKDWNGRLDTIAALRCDGLVEVCYEINGVEVWGMVRKPDNYTVHYDITDPTDQWAYHETMGTWTHAPNTWPDNLEEHNDFDSPDWADTLMPATQCGHVAPSDASTRFRRQDLCVPVGSKGGN